MVFSLLLFSFRRGDEMLRAASASAGVTISVVPLLILAGEVVEMKMGAAEVVGAAVVGAEVVVGANSMLPSPGAESSSSTCRSLSSS